MKTRVFVLFVLVIALAVGANAQVCSGSAITPKAVCVMPQVFGPMGMVIADGNPNGMGNQMGFNFGSQNVFAPVNVGVGEALASLPLGSSGAGTITTHDAEGHLVPVFEDSLGPIMIERGTAIGRRAFNFGVDYQYFSFSGLQGQNLHNFQAVLVHSMMPGMMPDDPMMHDYMTLQNDLNLSINQTVVYGVFGITNRLEASIEVPIEAVHTRLVSHAHIVRTQQCEQPGYQNCTTDGAVFGEWHYFGTPSTPADALANTEKTFTNSNDATGPGDVMVRAKYQVLGREGSKNAASIGIAFRTPTGDAKNFLGAGALGVGPYGAFTRLGRFSPHALFGYQYNGRSVLFSDPTVAGSTNSHLPPSFFYSGGADFRATKRITVAADLIGSRVLDASVLTTAPAMNMMGDMLPNTIGATYDRGYSYNGIAAGAKVRIKRSLVLTGNVTTRVDNGGLRANVIPLVGLSYAVY